MHANKTERGIAHPHVFESLFCQRVYYFTAATCARTALPEPACFRTYFHTIIRARFGLHARLNG